MAVERQCVAAACNADILWLVSRLGFAPCCSSLSTISRYRGRCIRSSSPLTLDPLRASLKEFVGAAKAGSRKVCVPLSRLPTEPLADMLEGVLLMWAPANTAAQ